jgi:hypothetical protein
VVMLATLATSGSRLSGQVMVGPPQPPLEQNAPGRPTVARIYVLNKDPRTEAVPVTVANAAELQKVTVTGVPTVTVQGRVSVDAMRVQQRWEYRQLVVGSAQDTIALLNAAGLDGWEATGAVLTWPGTTAVILKRPR